MPENAVTLETLRNGIAHHLETMVRLLKSAGVLDVSFYEFIQRHGKFYEGQKRPKGIRKGVVKECFSNSQKHLLGLYDTRKYRYVEGFAASLEVGFPIYHGWLVNVETGKVLDLTWRKPEESVYFGVMFKTDFVNSVVAQTGFWGSLIDSPQDRWKLLKGERSLEDALDIL
jgi:hypothetical protein